MRFDDVEYGSRRINGVRNFRQALASPHPVALLTDSSRPFFNSRGAPHFSCRGGPPPRPLLGAVAPRNGSGLSRADALAAETARADLEQNVAGGGHDAPGSPNRYVGRRPIRVWLVPPQIRNYRSARSP